MTTSLAELAQLVGGRIVSESDVEHTELELGELNITGAARLDHACCGEISFADRPERAREVARSAASAVITAGNVDCGAKPLILVEDVHAAFAKAVRYFRPPAVRPRGGISEYAQIGQNVEIGKDVEIQAGAFIGDNVAIGDGATIHSGARIMSDCMIGSGSTLFPNVVLYEGVLVGQRCLIHSGAVLGAYGFGYTERDGRHQLSEQLGYVEIGDEVEIGAGSTIDRGTYGATIVGEGTKIDNLVMIAHNCHIGRHNLICSQVGIAGSSTTGDYVVLAGQAGVRDHVQIGVGAVIGSQSGVSHEVAPGSVVLGSPASCAREQKVRMAAVAKLPAMRKEFRALQREVQQLQERLAGQTRDESERAA